MSFRGGCFFMLFEIMASSPCWTPKGAGFPIEPERPRGHLFGTMAVLDRPKIGG